MRNRRDFIGRIVTGALVAAAAPFAWLAARYLGPVRTTPTLVTLPAWDLPDPGASMPLKVGTLDVLLVRRSDRSLVAFNLLCTHMACTVAWKPERGVFHCPCHNGSFSAEGEVLDGPPKRPLARLPIDALPGGSIRLSDATA
jgi:cytochrome b6-f complex iron-sulfur subunit